MCVAFESRAVDCIGLVCIVSWLCCVPFVLFCFACSVLSYFILLCSFVLFCDFMCSGHSVTLLKIFGQEKFEVGTWWIFCNNMCSMSLKIK